MIRPMGNLLRVAELFSLAGLVELASGEVVRRNYAVRASTTGDALVLACQLRLNRRTPDLPAEQILYRLRLGHKNVGAMVFQESL